MSWPHPDRLTGCSLRIYDTPLEAFQLVAPSPGAEHDAADGAEQQLAGQRVPAQPPAQPQGDSFAPALRIQDGELLYDFCWYSCMSAADPALCCLATTGRGQPTHLWDALTGGVRGGGEGGGTTGCGWTGLHLPALHGLGPPTIRQHNPAHAAGELRCTYRAYNDLDEVAPAHSLAFDAHGAMLYCGFDRGTVRAFRVDRPGRDCITVAAYRKGGEGLPGAGHAGGAGRRRSPGGPRAPLQCSHRARRLPACPVLQALCLA